MIVLSEPGERGRVVAEIDDDVVIPDLGGIGPEQVEVGVGAPGLGNPLLCRRVASENGEVVEAVVRRPLGCRLVRHDIDRRGLGRMRRVEGVRVQRSPDVFPDLEGVRKLDIGPHSPQGAPAGDPLQVGASAENDLAGPEFFPDDQAGRPPVHDDIRRPQDQLIVVFVTVPDIAENKIIGAGQKVGGLGENDALRLSFNGDIDPGRASARQQGGPDSVPRPPFVLAGHHPDPEIPLPAEIQQGQHRIVLSDFEAVEKPSFLVRGHGQGARLIRNRYRRLGHNLLLQVGQGHSDLASQPELPRLLDGKRLLAARIVDADLRPDHRVADHAPSVAHDRLPCDLALFVVQRHRIEPGRPQTAGPDDQGLPGVHNGNGLSILIDGCQGWTYFLKFLFSFRHLLSSFLVVAVLHQANSMRHSTQTFSARRLSYPLPGGSFHSGGVRRRSKPILMFLFFAMRFQMRPERAFSR
ncbi:MAG: hypothetical protein A4E72_01001 [Syntrophus sp. PtaU1.Bin208]|nr:MAG: hypothetical protein A4E72_01001 [Syntrophus sp. PtaU1.Bin208]